MSDRRQILGLTFCLLVAIAAVWGIFRWWNAAPRETKNSISIERPGGSKSLRLFFVGDTGTGDERQNAVARAMERDCQQRGVHGLVLLGDLFYMDGVESKTDDQWREKVWTPYGSPCLSARPIYVVLGNHDYRGSVPAIFEWSEKESRWIAPHRFYRVVMGDLLQLVAFDSNVPDLCLSPGICALDFLQESLSQSSVRWNIVFAHHPVISSSSKMGSHRGAWFFRWIMKQWLCEHADAYVAGHSHHMEHLTPADCSTELFVSGGGGGTLTPLGEQAEGTRFARTQHGFLALTATHESLEWSFHSEDGAELYRYVQGRNGG